MRYYYPNQNYLDVKIIAWFVSCLLIGAFLALLFEDPSHSANMYRRNNSRRRIELVEEEEQYMAEELIH